MSRGVIATAVKGAFKIYLVPAMRTRTAVVSVTEGWHDLVTQAREEYEADKQADELMESSGDIVATAGAVAPSVEGLSEQGASARCGPGTTRPTSQPLAADTNKDSVPARPGSAIETAPPVSRPAQPENELEAPASPTPVESGESSVEVRPNPTISPVHALAGAIAHLPPEVRHKLAGNGPIRA